MTLRLWPASLGHMSLVWLAWQDDLKLLSTAKRNQSGAPGRRGYFDLFIEVRKPPLKSMWSGLIYKEGMGFPKVGTGSQSYLFFPEDFVIQAKADCYFTNGTEQGAVCGAIHF